MLITLATVWLLLLMISPDLWIHLFQSKILPQLFKTSVSVSSLTFVFATSLKIDTILSQIIKMVIIF